MVYITNYNARRILNELELAGKEFSGNLYEKPLFMFNKLEQKLLLAFKEFIQSPDEFVGCKYQKIEVEDSYRYIYEGGAPAYHERLDCERLSSDFRNFEIPEEIREKGQETVEKFRKWFKDKKDLLDKPDVLKERIRWAFGVDADIRIYTNKNTGFCEKENLSLIEIKDRLDKLIKEAGRFYYESSQNKKIIQAFGKRTFLARKDKPLPDNDIDLKDDEIKNFLIEYEDRFKKPIANYLREYYRISFNPDLAIDKKILDELGFKPCAICCQH